MNWKTFLALVLLNLAIFSMAAFGNDPVRIDESINHRMDIPGYLFSANEFNDSLHNPLDLINHEDKLRLPIGAIPAMQPGMDWSKTFGGADLDYGIDAIEVNDGGYVFLGITTVDSYSDIYLAKTDSLGNKLWESILGGLSNDLGLSVLETSDGDLIVAGKIGDGGDLYLAKTDSSGNMLWNRTHEGHGHGFSVLETNDGDLIVAGSRFVNGLIAVEAYLMKTDSSGNLLWDKTFGGDYMDYGFYVQATNDDGYIITGSTNSYGSGNDDVWLIKTDSVGNELWNETFGGMNNDSGRSVVAAGDGSYIIAGSTESYGSGNSDVWLIKTDSAGNELWNKTFGGTVYDGGTSVQQTVDGGYIITGSTESYGSGNRDVWLIKTDSNGNELWNKTFGGVAYDIGNSVEQTSDKGYIISGATNSYGSGGSDIWLIKIKPSGRLYYPDFTDTANPDSWRSWLVLQNPMNSPASINLDIRSRAGDPLYSGELVIPAYGVNAIRPRSLTGIDCAGSVVVTSDQPIIGTCQITRNNNEMCMSYNAMDQVSTTLSYPDFTDTANPDGWRSWLVLQNPASTAANINLVIRSRAGDQLYSGSQLIPAHGVAAIRPRNLVGFDCTGSAVVTSDQPLVGTCQITRNNNLMCMSYTASGAISVDWLPPI